MLLELRYKESVKVVKEKVAYQVMEKLPLLGAMTTTKMRQIQIVQHTKNSWVVFLMLKQEMDLPQNKKYKIVMNQVTAEKKATNILLLKIPAMVMIKLAFLKVNPLTTKNS